MRDEREAAREAAKRAALEEHLREREKGFDPNPFPDYGAKTRSGLKIRPRH